MRTNLTALAAAATLGMAALLPSAASARPTGPRVHAAKIHHTAGIQRVHRSHVATHRVHRPLAAHRFHRRHFVRAALIAPHPIWAGYATDACYYRKKIVFTPWGARVRLVPVCYWY